MSLLKWIVTYEKGNSDFPSSWITTKCCLRVHSSLRIILIPRAHERVWRKLRRSSLKIFSGVGGRRWKGEDELSNLVMVEIINTWQRSCTVRHPLMRRCIKDSCIPRVHERVLTKGLYGGMHITTTRDHK